MASHIMSEASAKGSRCIFLAHRKELIDQASSKLDAFGIDHGHLAHGLAGIGRNQGVEGFGGATAQTNQLQPQRPVGRVDERLGRHHAHTRLGLDRPLTPWAISDRDAADILAEARAGAHDYPSASAFVTEEDVDEPGEVVWIEEEPRESEDGDGGDAAPAAAGGDDEAAAADDTQAATAQA